MTNWCRSGCLALLAAVAAGLLAGCASPSSRAAKDSLPAANVTDSTQDESASSIRRVLPVAWQVPSKGPAAAVPEPPPMAPPVAPEPAAVLADPTRNADDMTDPFADQPELPLERLVAEVRARNPSLQAMSAAWRAAAERYPQVVSLEDPMFGFMVSPSGVGRDGGWMVEASQKLVWARKRALRGKMATAEADAACGDVADTRLRLAEATKVAFFDYYLAAREMEVNADTISLVRQLREIAKTMYQSNQASEQDVLQAEVELADLEGRRLALVREERIAVARINTLLHRAADHPLPPPPARIDTPVSLPSPDALAAAALESRPDLAAQAARVRAEEAAIALECKEFFPDLEVVGKYDAFMPEEMRPQVGMNLNVPLQRSRRWAAVRESQAKLQQRRAELAEQADQVRFEVQSAFERLAEGQQVVRLYTEKILPAAETNLKSAQINYTAGKVDFLRLIEAERQLNGEREKYHAATADFYRRAAELERAIGGPLPVGESVN